FEKIGKRKFDVDKYGRRIVSNTQIEIHGYKFGMDLVVDEYKGTEEPSVVFGRDFLLATKCTLNFRLGETQINIGGLLEEKPVFHVLENYTYYRKMADEFPWIRKDWRRKRKLKKKRYRGKCLCHALQTLQGFGTRKAWPSNDKLLMADNTIARAYEKGIMTIDDGVVNHIKKRNKVVAEEDPKDDEDWLDVFEVWHDEKGYPKYGPTLPPFFNIEDEMEPALAMEAYFNSFKKIIVYKKLVDFLGSLPIQLKNIEWTSEGYITYRKIEGDEVWHAKFEVTRLSGHKFTRGFKTKETKRKLSGKFNLDDILMFEPFFD
ncbi:hypothetical protein Tco_1291070, partial [Tanacetum coccineum]